MNAVYTLFLLFTFLGGGSAIANPRNNSVSDNEVEDIFNDLPYSSFNLALHHFFCSLFVESASLIVCWFFTDSQIRTEKAWVIMAIWILVQNALGLGIDVLTTDESALSVLAWTAVSNYVIVTEFFWIVISSSYPFYSLLKRTKSVSSTTDDVLVQNPSYFVLVRVGSKILLLLTILCPGILTARFAVERLRVKYYWLWTMVKYQITPSILFLFLASSIAACLNLRKHPWCHSTDATWSVYSSRQKFYTLTVFFLSLLTCAQFVAIYFEIWALLRVFLVQYMAATLFFILVYFAEELGFVLPAFQEQRCTRLHTKFI